jgi:hypothetical protein
MGQSLFGCKLNHKLSLKLSRKPSNIPFVSF